MHLPESEQPDRGPGDYLPADPYALPSSDSELVQWLTPVGLNLLIKWYGRSLDGHERATIITNAILYVIDHYDPSRGSAVKTFFHMNLKCQSVTYLRWRSRLRSRLQLTGEHPIEIPFEPFADDPNVRNEVAMFVFEAVEELPAPEKLVTRLRFGIGHVASRCQDYDWEGELSWDEVSAASGLNPNQVAAADRRAKRKLRKSLGPLAEEMNL